MNESCLAVIQQGNERIDGYPCLTDDAAKRTPIEFTMIGNNHSSSRRWLFTTQNEVTATLPIKREPHQQQYPNAFATGNDRQRRHYTMTINVS